jgi:thiamine biosynthesis lipoprotein
LELTLLWFFTTAILAADGCQAQLERYQQVHPAMGTTFEIVLYAPDEPTAERACAAAFARIDQLNRIFSDYDPESEASRLGKSAPHREPQSVSQELWDVLQKSLRLSQETDGAFDVTVGPLTRLWRRAHRRRELPGGERLRQAQAAVGWQHVRLDGRTKTVQLLTADMRFDFGGVAKGYAGDEAIRVLRQHGIGRALINGGGDMAIGDPPPGQRGWRIGVAPLEPQQPPSRILLLANCGIATSGDAWQYVEIDGRRYSHLVDPRTGIGVTDRSSVTVVAPDGTTADSLASAVTVLGPQRGIGLVNRHGGAACLVVRIEDGRPQTYLSTRFASLEKATAAKDR